MLATSCVNVTVVKSHEALARINLAATVYAFIYIFAFLNRFVFSRGGTVDTRLETKHTKKNPRPRTALLRTDTLEAKDRKARGQGHKRKCSPKKKFFTKIFQVICRKKRLPKNFSGTPQNFSNSKNSAVLEPRAGQFSRI